MQIAVVVISLALIYLCDAHIYTEVYKRIFHREGIPDREIPEKELDVLARSVERAQNERDVEKAEGKFHEAVKKSYRWRFPAIDIRLAQINRIFRWIITFQTQLGRLFDSFNISASAASNFLNNVRTGYQREAVKYKGDFSKIHGAIEKLALREASKWLNKKKLREFEHRISELNQKEHKTIMMAYELTAQD